MKNAQSTEKLLISPAEACEISELQKTISVGRSTETDDS